EIPALIEELHVCLQEVIRKPGARSTTGSFLSGGLDSSSISGTLARVSDTAAKTFSVGFGDNEYDELKFARIAIEEFECDSFEYQMTPQDIVNVFPKIAAQFDEPFGNSSAAPTYFCAKLAADNGVSDLLAGDGGDEIFGGNERYVRHRIFEFYNRLPGWLRTGLIEPATRLVHPDSRVMPLRKARSYVDQALIPLPERFESWNLAYREGSEQMLTTQFSESIDKDGPFQIMQSVWNAAPSDDLLEKMLWYDWHFTLADSDLRKVGTMCELANVRVSYPLLSDPIVALSNRVHPKMKINGTDLRVFFKDAMKGFLPPQIINKKKHGFGLPFGLWLKTDSNLRDLIYTNLSGLKKRQIVRTDFIDNVVQAHHAGHASYYGYILWDLAMLEAWLACHEDSASIGNT
ncbi:MAG: asparagine synthase C-terminal domain-containing protein, partial [Pseudomonadota bacterium]